ncbi:MAG: DAK2 domain-containing protein [Candidatus Limnocylindrales bacterium]
MARPPSPSRVPAHRSCDGTGLLGAVRAAVANLEAHVLEINELNVYPVPDGDTGSNMLATVRAALDEAEAEAEAGRSVERIAAAVSHGALMGARGNSGVITSQIFRGMAESLGGNRRFDGRDLADALSQGAKLAYAAVATPVEGTILTVIRESADAAQAAAKRDPGLAGVLEATVQAAERSVARTPDLLPILREAGVVDSGGQGLYRLFQGAWHEVSGRAPAMAPGAFRPRPGRGRLRHGTPSRGAPDPGVRRRVRLRDDVPRSGPPRRPRSISGPSGIISARSVSPSWWPGTVGRSRSMSTASGRTEVIAYGLGVGSLSRISIENLDDQATDVREHRAAASTGAADGPTDRPADGPAHEPASPMPEPGTPLPDLAVVAVAAGEGLAAIFRDVGVARVIVGGRSANPSIGELLDAIAAVPAREIVLLPNDPNILLAGRQIASMPARSVVRIVPTRNAAEGFAALLALDSDLDAAANVGPMTEAGRAVQTLVVTEAVRDATIGGRAVRRGQTMALDPDDGLVAADDDRETCVLLALDGIEPGYELVTLFHGKDVERLEADALADRIRAARPDIEVEVRHGGQPHERYLISAE